MRPTPSSAGSLLPRLKPDRGCDSRLSHQHHTHELVGGDGTQDGGEVSEMLCKHAIDSIEPLILAWSVLLVATAVALTCTARMSWWEATAPKICMLSHRYFASIFTNTIELLCLTSLTDMVRSDVAPAFCNCAPSLHTHPNPAIALQELQTGNDVDVKAKLPRLLLLLLLLSPFCCLAQPVRSGLAAGEGDLKHKIFPSKPRPPCSETLRQAALLVLQEAGPMSARRRIV
jgi:hypothetical protein